MKTYVSPNVEFIEFEMSDIVAESQCEYVCPDEYGNTCSGNPYGAKKSVSSSGKTKNSDKVVVGFDLRFDK